MSPRQMAHVRDELRIRGENLTALPICNPLDSPTYFRRILSRVLLSTFCTRRQHTRCAPYLNNLVAYKSAGGVACKNHQVLFLFQS